MKDGSNTSMEHFKQQLIRRTQFQWMGQFVSGHNDDSQAGELELTAVKLTS